MARKSRIYHIHPKSAISNQTTAPETTNILCVSPTCNLTVCLYACLLVCQHSPERFLCDFGIKSWFSSIAAWKLFGMLWVFIWLNCTTKHRCMSHWGTMQIFVKIFELFILTDCCTHVYIDAHDCKFTVYCTWLYINSVLYVNFLFDL